MKQPTELTKVQFTDCVYIHGVNEKCVFAWLNEL